MYKALYRKWRPRTFAEVCGQTHVVETLRAEVRQGRVSHAYLFCGVRGTGKTTCAKILSKAVNCLDPRDGEPCLRCDNCAGIENGSLLDVYEIDAASNNGVDNIRDLRDEAVYAPATALRRVYIIDEAHMLSTGAFNAFLKLLEEPPAGVIFILATTEASKIPATIVSRCQRFQFARLEPDEIAGRLALVAAEEGIVAAGDAMALIARLADGSLRDALSILDRCSADGRDITYELVAETAGVPDGAHVMRLSRAAGGGDFAAAATLLDELARGGMDMFGLCGQLAAHYRDLLMIKSAAAPGGMLMSALDRKSVAELEQYARDFDGETLVYNLKIVQDTMDRLARSANQRIELELCLFRLCRPGASASGEALLKRVADLERRAFAQSVPVVAPQPEPAADVGMPQPGRDLPPEPPAAATAQAPEPDAPDDDDAPPWDDAPAPQPQSDARPEDEPPALAPAQAAQPDVADTPAEPEREAPPAKQKKQDAPFWGEVQTRAARLPRLSGFIAMARAYVADGELVVAPKNAIAGDMLSAPAALGELTALVAEVSGQKLPVRIEPPGEQQARGDLFDLLAERET